MKKIALVLFLFPYLNFAQKNEATLVDSLCFIENLPHCLVQKTQVLDSNALYWRIVRLKDKAIPYLIEHIDDTTTTTVTIQYFGGNYTLGDIAYEVLKEIIKDIPTFEILGIPYDSTGCGYCSYWQHLNDLSNRKKFKIALQKWYYKNQENLIWKGYKWEGEICFYRKPIIGYYILEK